MDLESRKWTHLDPYEKRYLKEAIEAYDQIMQITSDIPKIASRYQVSLEGVQRAKNYAFGEGVSQYQFSPDIRMAEAWIRMAEDKGTNLDEILLRHEVFESDLVVNQGMRQKESHNLAESLYPWSELLNS